MQERDQHHSVQREHWERGIANRFRERFGFKPSTFAFERVYLPQDALDKRRSMRRITRDGR